MTMIALTAPEAPAGDASQVATVQVWLGSHRIANWTGDPAEAPAIAAAWDRRYGITPVVSLGVEW